MTVGGRHKSAHRALWEELRGDVPDGFVVDHTCGNPLCVNIKHLRQVPHQENTQYRVNLSSNNTSGYRGVTLAESGRWIARVMLDGTNHYVGRFDTADEANRAAIARRQELYPLGEFERTA